MPLNLTGKKLAVVGSRTFDDKNRLYDILTKNRDRIKLIVSGGAEGADTLAVEWAKEFGMPYLVFPAMWRDPITKVFDRGAGFRRNRWIVEYSDTVMAFWDGISGGTANTLKIAEQLNRPVKIFKFTPVIKTDEEIQREKMSKLFTELFGPKPISVEEAIRLVSSVIAPPRVDTPPPAQEEPQVSDVL